MTRKAGLAAVFVLALTGSCRPSSAPDVPLSSALDAWLHCEECTAGEREAVSAIGAGIVTELRAALLTGPSSAQQDHMREEYVIAHRSLGPDTSSGLDEYVELLLANYVATYQKRTAMSLADIGGPAARDALRDALEPGQVGRYRDDVRTAIRVAHVSLTDRWFDGTVSPAAPAFGDTVEIAPGIGQLFAGDELVHIEGALFPETAVRVAVAAARLRFVVTAPVGQRMLTVRREAAPDTTFSGLVVRSLADANDRALAHCVDLACMRASAPQYLNDSGSVSMFLSLGGAAAGSDTLDLFRFEPVALLRVVAEVDWQPDGNVDLHWTSCAPPTPLTDSTWTAGARTRGSAISLISGSCGLLHVRLSSPGAGVSAVRLRLTATRPIP